MDAERLEIEIAAATKELLSKQRDDGGWAQLDSGEPMAAGDRGTVDDRSTLEETF